MTVGRLDPPPWLRTAERLLVRARAERVVTATNLVTTEVMNNLTGTPAMAVPLHWTETGLPLGTRFISAAAGEGLLLRLAARLEEASPWAERRPAGVAFPAGV